MWDDDEKPTAGKKAKPKNLDPISVEELNEYVAMLKTEIERAEAEITRKSATRAAADAFFK